MSGTSFISIIKGILMSFFDASLILILNEEMYIYLDTGSNDCLKYFLISFSKNELIAYF